jgi:hypothetical protein
VEPREFLPNAIFQVIQRNREDNRLRYTDLGTPRYPYSVEPIQLAYLINELERLKGSKGNIAEIGVASGKTTRFLCEHIVAQNISTLTYFAMDIFSSFLKKDIEFEITNRNKKQMNKLDAFAFNDFDLWKKNFSHFPFVKAINADCQKSIIVK